jgi:hypothetical protein
MAYPPNHTFSAPVEYHQDYEWNHARLFTENRRLNGLNINTGRISGGNVEDIQDDGNQMDDAIEAAAADLLGPRYGYARAGLIRRALRGDGRGRFR